MSASGRPGEVRSAFVRLRAALVSADAGGDSGGIGCDFWTRPTLGVPVDELEALGLVKTIQTRVPLCEEHGCAVIATCPARVIFAEKQAGRAGRKFRLTALGIGIAGEPTRLADRLSEQPVAGRILAALAEAGGPLGWMELYWRLLEPELETLAETGHRPAPALSRAAVRFYLDLSIAAGLLLEDSVAQEVWLPAT